MPFFVVSSYVNGDVVLVHAWDRTDALSKIKETHPELLDVDFSVDEVTTVHKSVDEAPSAYSEPEIQSGPYESRPNWFCVRRRMGRGCEYLREDGIWTPSSGHGIPNSCWFRSKEEVQAVLEKAKNV